MEFLKELFSTFWFETIFKLFLGFLLAGIIGLERDSWNKPAGFRTHALLGISGVLVMVCGEYLYNKYNVDLTRIPAQLLSGIGFIGAGTILRDGFNVKGLTTASGLLTVTCIGLSIGAGFYLGGILATLITFVVLAYSHVFSDKLEHFDVLNLKIVSNASYDKILPKLQFFIENYEINLKEISQTKIEDSESISIKIVCKYNNKIYKKNQIITKLSLIEGIKSVTEN